MTLKVSLDNNVFEVDGYQIGDILSLYRSWLNVQGGEQAVTIEALTEQLRSNTDALNQAIVGLNQGEA
jgi:hypothetical protein